MKLFWDILLFIVLVIFVAALVIACADPIQPEKAKPLTHGGYMEYKHFTENNQ